MPRSRRRRRQGLGGQAAKGRALSQLPAEGHKDRLLQSANFDAPRSEDRSPARRQGRHRLMAALRITPTGTRLEAVRDEDVGDEETPWERMLRLDVVVAPRPRLAEVAGATVVVERAPGRRRCAATS